MNFSEFSFWWILFLVSVPFFTVRYISKTYNLWQDAFDAIGLAFISLFLFVNTNAVSFIVFSGELAFNYLMVRWMLGCQDKQAKWIAISTIAFDLSILVYFKYLTFFIEGVFAFFVGDLVTGWQSTSQVPLSTSIPPGISFYTFQMVAFVVDSFRAQDKRSIGFLNYINFISFFPQIVAGPIERRATLLPQLENFRFKFTADNFDWGLRWVCLGFFMKLVLADNIAPFIDLKEATNVWLIWFNILLFSLRIYFDFAGYSFMALGIARVLGIRLTLNFKAPYASLNIQEFWQRWHITLSQWFRDYLYIPLGGSRVPWAAANLLIVFFVSGLWHGAGWNFIIWGGYHGCLLVAHRYLRKYIHVSALWSWICTLMSVMISWLFFMETNIYRLAEKLITLMTPFSYSPSRFIEAMHHFNANEILALSLILFLSGLLLLSEYIAVRQKHSVEYDILLSPWTSTVLLGATIILAANIPSEFIYFEF